MKKNNKGFSLIETLIVSSFVVGTLVFLFSQFVVLKNNYNRSFKYNTVQAIYKAKNIDRYLSGIEYRNIINGVGNSSRGYVDISNCTTHITNNNYCKTLFSKLDVKTVVVSKENLDNLKEDLNSNNPYTESFYQFIERQKEKITGSNYRIIVEFNDDTYATVVLSI